MMDNKALLAILASSIVSVAGGAAVPSEFNVNLYRYVEAVRKVKYANEKASFSRIDPSKYSEIAEKLNFS